MNDLAKRLKTEGFVELDDGIAEKMRRCRDFYLAGAKVVKQFLTGNKHCPIIYTVFDNGSVLEFIYDAHIETNVLTKDDLIRELGRTENSGLDELRRYAGLYKKLISSIDDIAVKQTCD